MNVALGNWSLSSPMKRIRLSRLPSSLVSVLTSTSNDAALTCSVPFESLNVMEPVMALVLPTASLNAGRPPSCSRTRYPALDPEAIFHEPERAVAAPDVAAAELDGELSVSGAGDAVGNTNRYTTAIAAAPASM